MLRQQNLNQTKVRKDRVENISNSIRTIAFAMEQQQCDSSEGAIRICNLLNAIPITDKPNYETAYPALFELYNKIKHFPMLEERRKLPSSVKKQQDKEREQIESELSSRIQKEVTQLRKFYTT